MPLTGVLVMPAGMLGLALMPFGIERPALIVMGWGNEGVLWIARAAAALPGATVLAPHMPPWGLLVVAFGMIWLALWRSRLRLAGIAVIVLGLASPALVRPPDLLVSAEGRLIAVRTPAGVFLQQVSGGSKFTRESWLHYWAGDRVPADPAQGEAADGTISCDKEACMLRPLAGAKGALLVRGAAHPGWLRRGVGDRVGGACARAVPQAVAGAGRPLHRVAIRRHRDLAGCRPRAILTDRAYRGVRPWVPPLPVPRARAVPPSLKPALTDTVPIGE